MYPDGIDAVWVGMDESLNLGAFVTAGAGPVPKIWLDHDDLFPEVEDHIGGLPVIGRATMLVELKRPDDFVMMAERGFYVFDWTDIHKTQTNRTGKYEPVARPQSPISFYNAPRAIRDLIGSCKLDEVDFSNLFPISLPAHLNSVENI